VTRKREQSDQTPRPDEKGVMGNQRSNASRKSFLRELKRAARGRLDKRSPSQ
jgi:hypothetical protein